METRTSVTLFVDGNHSVVDDRWTGGWGYKLLMYRGHDTHERSQYGFEAKGTNYAMKLTAIAEGIKALSHPCKVLVVVNDEAIVSVAKGMRQIIARKGKTKGGKMLAYPELWINIIEAANEGHHELIFRKASVAHMIQARTDSKVIMKT